MDLMDQIDGVRFLGREWLLYLWYESERMGADDVEALRADNPRCRWCARPKSSSRRLAWTRSRST
jgi:hypothetical protein